jgi:hypothetical protein
MKDCFFFATWNLAPNSRNVKKAQIDTHNPF